MVCWLCWLIWQDVQRERDHLSTENNSLVTRLNAITDILTTQEHYLTQVHCTLMHLDIFTR